MAKSWWQVPKFRTDGEENRTATWLELFFDLVFVIAIFQLSHVLSDNPNWHGVFSFTILFIPVLWVWIGATFYNNRFETNDISQRIFTFLKIIAVSAMALNIHHGTSSSAVGFALSYAAARSIITIMWIRAGYHNPFTRPVAKRYVIGFSLSIFLWIISVFVPQPAMFVFWIAGLTIDLITPFTSLKLQEKLPKLSKSHLPERFGLFTMIVLGELIISVMLGITELGSPSFKNAMIGVLGLSIAFALWWYYFDHIMERKIKKELLWTALWSYSHIPLMIGMTSIGAGLTLTISQASSSLSLPSILILCAGVLSTLVSMGLIELSLERRNSCKCTTGKIVRFGAAAITIPLAFITNSVFLLLSVLLSLILTQILYGYWFSTHPEIV